MTIKQNEYVHIRKGDSGLIPGPGASSNIYAANGLSHCIRPYISTANNNNLFYYIWTNGTEYTVVIPDGYYDITSLNNVFQATLVANGHTSPTMNISYDVKTQSVILYAGANSGVTPLPPNPGYTSGATYFVVPINTSFSTLIGFQPGTYFGGITMTGNPSQIPYAYVPLYYKPNNSEFGVQGAVDSSTLLQRIKYNTLTTAAGGIRSIYGQAAASALSYGVSEQAYTIKSKVGDKPNLTPVINPRSGIMCRKSFIYRT
jgi:hypothetical protein